MFLKEIETKPAEGMTQIAFKKLQADGENIPEILHLFRYKRRTTDHLIRFTDAVMRGPSSLSPGLRELIGAYFSKRNQCSFCSDAHAAAAAEYMERELVDEVLHDVETSRLNGKHKALFRYIAKLAEHAYRVTDSDIAELKSVGWTEDEIYDALTVASMFKFYNTWNSGAGVQNMTSADYVYSGRVLRTLGYCMDFTLTRLVRIAVRRLCEAIASIGSLGRSRNFPSSRPWPEANVSRPT